MSTTYTTNHYSFMYVRQLTEEELAKKEVSILIDPYFVSNHWKLGSKDESGALFHNLKTIARFGYKNHIEREIRALVVQSAALARVNKIDIADTINSLLPEDRSKDRLEVENADLKEACKILKEASQQVANGTLANRISELERQVTNYKSTCDSLLNENGLLVLESDKVKLVLKQINESMDYNLKSAFIAGTIHVNSLVAEGKASGDTLEAAKEFVKTYLYDFKQGKTK